MKWILFFSLLSPLNLFGQKIDSLVHSINLEVELIEKNQFNNKLTADTIKKVEEEYEHNHIVGWYEGRFLKMVSISNSDGAAGDISSIMYYYFNNGKLIMIYNGQSYFMAHGCSVIEKMYFYKNDFIQLTTTTDCIGENAKTVKEYLGDYSFGITVFVEEFNKIMEGITIFR